jgi:branched-chain amino acid aminotransferase
VALIPTAPFDDRDGFIWFDGQLVPWREAKIHVLTHGLHYASCVFEGERAYGGRIFQGRAHTDRLFRSAEILDFQIPFSREVIGKAKAETLAAMKLKDAYIRPVAWRGSEIMGVTAKSATIHVAIACWEWPSYFDPAQRAKGIRLDISAWRRPGPDMAPTQAKAAGLYMICTLSKHAAERKGCADALMYDYRGLIAEATGANIFLIKDGVLHTPTPDCFLDGLTRQTVIGLAKRRGLAVVERHIEAHELPGFSEVFITGTAAEVTPVSEIGPHRFTPGPISHGLMADYDEEVRKPETV